MCALLRDLSNRLISPVRGKIKTDEKYQTLLNSSKSTFTVQGSFLNKELKRNCQLTAFSLSVVRNEKKGPDNRVINKIFSTNEYIKFLNEYNMKMLLSSTPGKYQLPQYKQMFLCLNNIIQMYKLDSKNEENVKADTAVHKVCYTPFSISSVIFSSSNSFLVSFEEIAHSLVSGQDSFNSTCEQNKAIDEALVEAAQFLENSTYKEYVIREFISAGNFGKVFAVQNKDSSKIYVVKISNSQNENKLSEVEILEHLSSEKNEYVTNLLQVFFSESKVGLLLEFAEIDGVSTNLRDFLVSRKGNMDELKTLIGLALDINNCLEYIHLKKVVNFDVKP
eukprot:snap_masked-scaffold_26-processed-gene-1.36-mRNA-1 protein AED:1.00 eAED:1.00 QI:0/-1/0/0/-1/1/1/0/334